MSDKYEVSVTIGVRQANMGPSSFTASDTFTIEATGFSELMDVLTYAHNAANQLRARADGPDYKHR